VTRRAVVLARGLGRRMQTGDTHAALTPEQTRAADAGAKGMMPIGGRPFLDYVLNALADAGVSVVALVVAPDHHVIAARYQRDAPPARLRLEFIVQTEAVGTADAVLYAERWIASEPFLVLNSDNLYPADTLRALRALDEPGLAVFTRAELLSQSNIPAERIAAFALVRTDARGYLTGIVEKPGEAVMATAGDSALVSMNCWRFDARIFACCRDVPRSARGEFELPEAVALGLQRGLPFRAVAGSGTVLDLSRRADLAEVERRLRGVTPRP
jgi:glucose-1-phosphate thymidylyltransferase